MKPVALLILLTVAVFAVFGRAAGFDFINYDDPVYVDNPFVMRGLTWDGIVWAFTGIDSNYSQSLPWLSFMLDRELYGRNPVGFHLTSVVLHTFNTLLVFELFRRMTGAFWRSAFVAALFAFHPLHVEPVVWVADRKDLLMTLFGLLAVGAYVRYARKGKGIWLVVSTLCYALALLGKPVLVMLPLVLFLLDGWPLNRWPEREGSPSSWKNRVVEKIPMLGLSVLFVGVALFGHQTVWTVIEPNQLPWYERLAMVPVNYVFYLGRTVYPVDLAVLYPLRWTSPPFLEVILSSALLVGITVIAVRCWKRFPYIAVGWGWFVLMLLPLSGFVTPGPFDVADRYTYFPLIGLLFITAWGLHDVFKNDPEWLATSFAGVLLGGLIGATWFQVGFWKDNVTLYTQVIRVTEKNFIIHNNLGQAWLDRGYPDRAVRHFKEAIGIFPTFFHAHYGLGNTYSEIDRVEDALDQYEAAIKLDPNHPDVRYEAADLYDLIGDGKKAVQHLLVAEFLWTKELGAESEKVQGVKQRLGRYFRVYGLSREQFPQLVENP